MKPSCIAFAAAVILSSLDVGSTSAADLSGDCCGDLEERIAELEGLTALKGGRKMSLSITGSLSRIILNVDDGRGSYTYYGLDNTNSASRYNLYGQAKLSSEVKVGFYMLFTLGAGGTSSSVSQLDEDGKAPSKLCPITTAGCPSFNEHNVDSYFADARNLVWWIEHEELGRVTVGRALVPGVWTTLDLTGQIFNVASAGFGLLNGGFLIRGPTGQYYSIVWGNITDPAAAFSRTELVRYDTPTYYGFLFSSSVAESGDYFASHLRYLQDKGPLRAAGVVSYEHATEAASPGVIDPSNISYIGRSPDVTAKGLALSAMHVPSGVFLQGHYMSVDYGRDIIGAASGFWGQSTVHKKPTDQWLVQAGIAKSWFDYGQTSIYGEYAAATDWGADFTNAAGTTLGRDYAVPGFTPVRGVVGTQLTIWGVGVAQDLAASSTTLFAGYRRFNADVRCADSVAAATCSGGVNANAAPGTFVTHKLPTEGANVLVVGSRVRF
jgi:hypothetical protein